MTGSGQQVFIVLATWQGGPYLAEQLASLRRQTCRGWQVLARDDGSTDGTLDLLRASADLPLHVVEQPPGRLGPAASFGTLLELALSLGADYVFCTDQDDVWLPEKVAMQLAELRAAERALGRRTPLLLHSDLLVVDSRLRLLHRSFLRYQRLDPRPLDPFRTLLTHNFATGCTLLANRALLEAACPLPAAAPAHDWWLALVAAALGKLIFLPRPMVLYRQHEQNHVGAAGFWGPLAAWRSWGQKWRSSQENLQGGIEQARELSLRWDAWTSAGLAVEPHAVHKQALEQYLAAWGAHGRLRRCWRLHRLGVGPPDWLRRAAAACQWLGPAAPLQHG